MQGAMTRMKWMASIAIGAVLLLFVSSMAFAPTANAAQSENRMGEALVAADQLVEHGARHAPGIHVALPVVAGDDTTLSELIATGEQLLHRLVRLVDVCQQQCRRPEEHTRTPKAAAT